MTDYFDDESNEFDKQVSDFFNGIGEKRTPLSGLWKQYINQVCYERDNGWQCVTAWHSDTRIGFTMESPEAWHTVHEVDVIDVCLLDAVSYVASIEWQAAHPRDIAGKAGVQYEPDGTLYKKLWYQCWLDCSGDGDKAQEMYHDLLAGTHPEIGL